MVECDWCELQKSADLLQELHAVVGQHADTIELQQTEICRLDSEVADALESCVNVQKERDDALSEIEHVQQQNEQQVAQQNMEV